MHEASPLPSLDLGELRGQRVSWEKKIMSPQVCFSKKLTWTVRAFRKVPCRSQTWLITGDVPQAGGDVWATLCRSVRCCWVNGVTQKLLWIMAREMLCERECCLLRLPSERKLSQRWASGKLTNLKAIWSSLFSVYTRTTAPRWRSGDSMQDLLLPPTKCVLKVKLGSSGLAVGVSLRWFHQIIPDSWERTGVSGRQEWEWKYRLRKRAGLLVFVLECHSSLRPSMLPHPPPLISQNVSQPNLFPLLCFEGGIWSIRKSGMSSSIAQAIKSCKVFDFPEHQLWTLDDNSVFHALMWN